MQPSLEEFRQLSAKEVLVPVWEKYLVDRDTPISIYEKVGGGAYSYLLESVEGGEQVARYSFIGLDPFLVFSAKDGSITLDYGHRREVMRGNPFSYLKQLMQQYRVGFYPQLPRFWGGAVGFFGYDMVRYLERLPEATADDLGWPDCCLVFTRVVLVYDHVTRQLRIIYLARGGDNATVAYQEAASVISGLGEKIASPGSRDAFRLGREQPLAFAANISAGEFQEMVHKARDYIEAGDLLQVVLSQRLEVPFPGRPLDAYRALRSLNPSPYMYYLDMKDYHIIGSSPEMLVRVEDGRIQTRPIAGTRRRGETPAEDEELARELVADPKERAEHLMLVDLGRNDVGRVSRYGTVRVSRFMELERYSHVMHLVSEVEGDLLPGYSSLDALAACFPAGTVSGAPKVRAMEVIEELELHRRGPYAGAVGYLGFGGNLDTCITIRTILLRQGRAYVQAGAGIVADSRPEQEYMETLNKARALLSALSMAAGPEGVEAHAVGD